MLELTERLIPLLIFVARIFDVSIGTVRMIMVISGHRVASAALGFVEVLIWVLAVGGAVEHLSNPIAVIAFAGGFAAGTLVGMTIENRLAIGFRVVRVINPKPGLDLAGALRERGYAATRLDGHDRVGPVEIVFVTIRRTVVPELLNRIAEVTPTASFRSSVPNESPALSRSQGTVPTGSRGAGSEKSESSASRRVADRRFLAGRRVTPQSHARKYVTLGELLRRYRDIQRFQLFPS